MMKRIVAHYRVSTKKQGISGLGLEGQKAAVGELSNRRGATLLAEYTEIQSGRRKDRPELAKALAHARRSKATLVVAKLDRLARNVAFLSALMESNADFVACDMEHANRLTIHILAAVAEAESKAISERTKTALSAAKARGTKLGSSRPGHWDGREDARLRGAKKGSAVAKRVRSEAADEAYADLYGRLKEIRDEGQTLRQIADDLNSEGHTTRRGKQWNSTQVLRVLKLASVCNRGLT